MKNKKLTIYLIGRMSGLTFDEANTWRKGVKYYLNSDRIKILNPCDYYNFENYIELKASDREVMDFDLNLVRNSDICLINLDNPSNKNFDYPNAIGSAIEVYEASEHCNIPVIGFGTQKNHEWVEASLNKKFNTMVEALDYIIDFYLPLYE